MPKPSYKSPRDELFASDWNGMVDWVDQERVEVSLPVSITTSTSGWYTIAHGDARCASIFIVEDSSSGRNNRFLFEALWSFGGASTERAQVRELSFVKYGLQTIHGTRILYDEANPLYGTAKLQVYLDPGGTSVTYHIYRINLTPANTLWLPWSLVDPPIQENAPAGYSTRVWTVAGNGNWHLWSAMTGTGTIGWMTSQDKQNTFTLISSDYWTFSTYSCLLDGNTSSVCLPWTSPGSYTWVIHWAVFDAGNTIILDGVRTHFIRGSGLGRWYIKHIVEASNDNTNWTTLGSYTSSEISYLTDTYAHTLSFSAASYRYWKVTAGISTENADTSSNTGIAEIDFSVAASIVMRGVPLGCQVVLRDATNTILESVRNNTWTRDAPLMFATSPSSVDNILITHPDGATNWLWFPTWSIRNWQTTGYQILSLYKR